MGIDLYSEAEKLSSIFRSRKAAEKIKEAIIREPEKYLPEIIKILSNLKNPKAKVKLTKVLLSALQTFPELRIKLTSMVVSKSLGGFENKLAIEVLERTNVPIKRYLDNQWKLGQLKRELEEKSLRKALEQVKNEEQSIRQQAKQNLIEAVQKQEQIITQAQKLLRLVNKLNEIEKAEKAVLKLAEINETEIAEVRKQLKITPLNQTEKLVKIIRKTYNKLQILKPLWFFTNQNESIYGFDWSPDGRYIAMGVNDGILKVFNSETGDYSWGIKLGEWSSIVDWSPDGRYIAIVNSDGHEIFISVIDTNSREVIWRIKLNSETYGIAWDPTGNYLAVGAENYLYIFNKHGELLWVSEKHPNARIWYIAWSPDGSKIAFNGGKEGESVVVYDSKDGIRIWKFKIRGQVLSLDWESCGNYLAVGSKDGYVYVFNHNGMTLWGRYVYVPVTNVAWDPTGNYLAVSTYGYLYLFTKEGKHEWIKENIWTANSTYAHGNLEWNKNGYLAVGGWGKLYVFDKDGDAIAESEYLGNWNVKVSWSPTDQTKIAIMRENPWKFYMFRIYFITSMTDVAELVRIWVNLCNMFINYNMFVEASEVLARASEVCGKLGDVPNLKSICNEVEGLVAFIDSVHALLESAVVEAYPAGKGLYRFVIRVENILDRVIEGLYVVFDKDVVKDYVVIGEGKDEDYRVKYPPLRPGTIIEKGVSVKALVSGRFTVPYKVCLGDLCVDKEFIFETE